MWQRGDRYANRDTHRCCITNCSTHSATRADRCTHVDSCPNSDTRAADANRDTPSRQTNRKPTGELATGSWY